MPSELRIGVMRKGLFWAKSGSLGSTCCKNELEMYLLMSAGSVPCNLLKSMLMFSALYIYSPVGALAPISVLSGGRADFLSLAGTSLERILWAREHSDMES